MPDRSSDLPDINPTGRTPESAVLAKDAVHPNPPATTGPDLRLRALGDWLDRLPDDYGIQSASLAPASADASFRRYFRVTSQWRGHASLIVMDAPPEHEDCTAFIAIARRLGALGVNVPEVLETNLGDGFLLLTDLGHTTYLSILKHDELKSASELYHDATTALIRIQQDSDGQSLPAYDRAVLKREMDLFPHWYVSQHLGHTLTEREQAGLDLVMERLIANALAQPQVTVHRDYHSRNLMVAAGSSELRAQSLNPGVLDFQDALCGPITYDLVSLFRDAYIRWDEEVILDWSIRYWDDARRAGLPVASDFSTFWRDFEWMGLQRHLKVLGIFARLSIRDGKHGYLEDLPRVFGYARQVSARYDELAPLRKLLDTLVPAGVSVGYTF